MANPALPFLWESVLKRIQKPKPQKQKPQEDLGPVRRDKRGTEKLRKHILEELDELEEWIQRGD